MDFLGKCWKFCIYLGIFRGRGEAGTLAKLKKIFQRGVIGD